MSDPRYNKVIEKSNERSTSHSAGDTNFELDSRLAADSFLVKRLGLCELRRFDDVRYDWLMLVPRRAGVIEFVELDDKDSMALALEVKQVSLLLQQHGQGLKLNVGALGNVVQQLHIHLVSRHEQDPAWPGPVWGHSPAQRFTPEQKQLEVKRWQALL